MKKAPKNLLLWLCIGIGAIFLFNTGLLVQLFFFTPGAPNIMEGSVNAESALGWLLGAFFCFYRLPLFWRKQFSSSAVPLKSKFVIRISLEWVPLWVGLVFFTHMISEVVSGLYHLYQIQPAWDWPDTIDFVQYPFLLLVLLSLPRRPFSPIARARMVLDGFLIITALITFSWYFLLGPMALSSNLTLGHKLVGAAFPLGDIVLCYYLIQIFSHGSKPGFKLINGFLLMGLASIIVANCIDGYQLVKAMHSLDLWENLTRCVGYMLIALGVQTVSVTRTERSVTEHADNSSSVSMPEAHQETPIAGELAAPISLWHALLAYAFVPAVGLLMIIIWRTGDTSILAQGVYLGGMILIGQVMLRQVLVLQETVFYNRELHHMKQQLSVNNHALSKANKRLEEQARELAAAYEQQRQLNELKNQFLLNVNHELRTPLTEIYGSLELLQRFQGTLDDETHATFLEHARNGCEELLALVDTVLDALRSDSDEKRCQWEVLSVKAVVHNVMDLFEPQKKQCYDLDLEIPEDLIVKADRQYLHQILRNLLSNAFKYSPTQTHITVGAQVEPVSTEVAEEQPAQVRVWVQDSGPGIAPCDIPLLFGKFVRLKRDLASSVRGTGLGLYISKQLVEAMGGRIWVESSGIDGEGSRFCFTLPTSVRVKQSSSS